MDGIDAVAGKFRSGNAVPIDRAVITADEWASIVAERDKLRAERDSVIAERDRLREVMAASAFVAKNLHDMMNGEPSFVSHFPAMTQRMLEFYEALSGITDIDETYQTELESLRIKRDKLRDRVAELEESLMFGINLIQGDKVGAEWKHGCRAFIAKARAALGDSHE